MTGRLTSRDSHVADAVERPIDAGGRWRGFAIGLFAIGTTIGGVLIATGSSLPPTGPVLLLALVLAVAVNRFVFFPTELAVTAEAAVLIAAIVGFRERGAVIGPWFVALLAGPLDLVHWRERSYVRMAYNAGHRMASTLVGAAMFDVVARGASSSTSAPTLVMAAAAASVAFACVEGAVGVVLLRVRNGEPWRVAARIELPMDVLALPLGAVGALAGFLGTEVGWWCAALVLVPVLFLPELVVAHRRRLRAVVIASTIGPAIAAVGLLALTVSIPRASTIVALGIFAVVMGIELRVDLPAPPVAAALVVAAAIVSGHAAVGGAAIVAMAIVATSMVSERVDGWWPPLVAGAAALAVAGLLDARPSGAAAFAVAALFELLVGARAGELVWTAPLVGVGIALAGVWVAVGALGAVALGLGLAAAFAAAAACGAPPWRSRTLGPLVARRGIAAPRVALVIAALVSLGLGCAVAVTGSPHGGLVFGAAATAAAVAAMVMTAVRQWRFAPRRRIWDASIVMAAVLVVVVVYPRAAHDDGAWAFAILGAALGACLVVGWPVVKLTAESRRATSSAEVGVPQVEVLVDGDRVHE